MRPRLCQLSFLLVMMSLVAASLSPYATLQAQPGAKEPVAKPDGAQAGKQAAQEDIPTRIQKLEHTVQRLENELRMRPSSQPNAMGIAMMAQTFAIIGMGLGAYGFVVASKLRKELQQLREDRNKPNSIPTEPPGLTNG